MPKKRTKRLEATAYHEAGHVVAAWRMRLALMGATVVATEDTLGSAKKNSGLSVMDEVFDESGSFATRVERSIIVALAGDAAQRHYSPRSWRGDQDDIDGAIELASQVCEDSEVANAYLAYLSVVARSLVTGPRWPVVRAVAEALLDQGTLSGDECRAVISRAEEKYKVAGRGPWPTALPPSGAEAHLLSMIRLEEAENFTLTIAVKNGRWRVAVKGGDRAARAGGVGWAFAQAMDGLEVLWWMK